MTEQTIQQQFAGFIQENGLPANFIDTINDYYLPLAQWINRQRPQDRTWIIGLNGAQGTGKSTLSTVLKSSSKGITPVVPPLFLSTTSTCHGPIARS